MLADRIIRRCLFPLALVALILSRPFAALGDVVNVFCTNAPGDSALINKAVSASKVGDVIVIHGPALITRTIVLVGGRKYRGDSRSTILTQANGANLTAMLASDSYVNNYSYCGEPVQISDLEMDGNKAHNIAPTVGIMLRSWFTSVEDMLIENLGGDGVRLTCLSANGTVLKNTCGSSRFSSLSIQNCNGNGFRVLDTVNSITDCQLLDSWIGESGKDAIDLDNAAGWFVERDHVWGVPQNAIVVNRLFCTTVSDNYVEDFGSGPKPGTWYGISGTLQGGVGTVIFGNRLNCLTNESQTGSRYVYLGLVGNYGVGAVSVTGNQIFGAGTPRGTAFDYQLGTATSLTVTSSGNGVTDVHTERVVGPGVSVSTGD